MSTQVITNPAGALRTVSDYRTMRDDSGEAVSIGSTIRQFKVSADVDAGEAVKLVVPTQTEPVRVAPVAGAADYLFVGFAAESCKAGGVVDVVVDGLAFATVGTGDATAGDALITAADGVTDSAAPSATTVVGTIVGVALASGSATQTIPVLVKHL